MGTSGLNNKAATGLSSSRTGFARFASLAYGGVFALTLGVSHFALAAETQFTPIISLSETYTDNVLLAPRGLEESDWVTEVTGGFNFSGTGRRARANLNYTPSFYTYAGQNKTDLRQRMSGSGEIEAMRDHIFITGNASTYQTFTGVEDDISISDRNISGDRVQVFAYSLGPEFRNRFGSKADATLSYQFRSTNFGQPDDPEAIDVADSIMHRVFLQVNSGEDFQRFRWDVATEWTKQQRNEDASDIRNNSIRANGRYSLTHTVAFTSSFGYRHYSYDNQTSDLSGVIWDLGVRLTPSRRAQLNVSYGKDQQNKHWTVNGSYQLEARTSVSISYNEQYTTSQEIQPINVPPVGQPQPVLPGLGGAFDFGNRTENPGNSLTNEVFLQKRFSVSLSHRFQKTSLSLNASDERHIFDGGTSEKVQRAGVQVSRPFGGGISAGAGLSYIGRDEDTGREDDTYFGSVTINRALTTMSSIFVSYDYTNRKSNEDEFDLRENAVTVGVTARF